MVQWTNLQWIGKFVNPTGLYITCEKSGGLHLTEPGLTAGKLTKLGRGLKLQKLAVDRNV